MESPSPEEIKQRLAELEKELQESKRREQDAERSLRQSEERFRLTFYTSPDSINLNRLEDGVYIDINQGFTKLTGYTREEVIGKSSLDLNIWHNPEDRRRLVDQLARDGSVDNLEAEFVTRDGAVRTGLMSARIIVLDGERVIISVTRDITSYRKLEQQLHQAKKLEAIGTLAGGIAHDFNNLMMGVQGNVSLLAQGLGREHKLFGHIRAIEEHISSATSLTRQLLGLARGGKYELTPVSVAELVSHSAEMFGRTRKSISIHNRTVEKPELVVEVDRSQLEQVMLNLLLNSAEAMEMAGEIYLDADQLTADPDFCTTHKLEPGSYCRISVTDTGHGMDEATKERVFDPFFTTREKERGTGLGLASAYGIVRNHKGAMTVYSEVGHGTTFSVYLPLSGKPALKRSVQADELVRGSETVLLVDDEEMITDIGRLMLENLGYRTLVANSGRQAVDIVREHGPTIDLVILDLIMPEMNGSDTFDALRTLEPSIRVMLSSGYSINGQATDIMARGCNGFIQKPFNLEELSRKLREIIDCDRE